MKGAKIVIGVPVRNEVQRLPMLMKALAAQEGAPPFTLALFFDNCDDGSEALVAAMAQNLPFSIVTGCCRVGGAPNAGLARRRAMALAGSVALSGVLLTSDADSRPASDWIGANLRALRDADIVAGRIVHGEEHPSPIQAQLEAYFNRLHRFRRLLDPVPWEAPITHHWTSATSLAMPEAVYRAIGGFPAIVGGEDAHFADAAARLGYRLRRDATVRVTTSTRRRGRAVTGFAATLSAWDRASTPPEVASPESEAWRYTCQARARGVHGSGDLAQLAERLTLPQAEVRQVAAECRNGEAFAARIVGSPPGGMKYVSLPRAERLLATLEAARLAGVA